MTRNQRSEIPERLGHWLGRAMVALVFLATVAGCGGADKEQPSSALESSARALSLLKRSEPPQALTVVSLNKVSETRVTRTVFEYTFQVSVRNDGDTRVDIALELISVPPGTVVVDGYARLPYLQAGEQVVLDDSITLRYDRVRPFDPAALTWRVTSEHGVVVRGVVAASGVMPAELEVVSLRNGSIIATATGGEDGTFATVPVASRQLSDGYLIRTITPSAGGQSNRQSTQGPLPELQAIYAGSSATGASNVTLVTTAVAAAAQSLTSSPAEWPQQAAVVANRGVANGLIPEGFSNITVALEFGQGVEADVESLGVREFVQRLASSMVYVPPATTGDTVCEEVSITFSTTATRCSARITEKGGKLYDKSGIGQGNVVVDVTVGNPDCRFTTIAEFTDNSHRMRVWHESIVPGVSCERKTAFPTPISVRLPPAATEHVGLDECDAPPHRFITECATRAPESRMRPGFFLEREFKTHRVASAEHLTGAADPVTIARRYGANLRRQQANVGNHTPAAVILVHGYTPSPSGLLNKLRDSETFGGGDGTWGDLPRLVSALSPSGAADVTGFRVYNFHWRTNASFAHVATDLVDAIEVAWRETGQRPVHIVAHSFGGLLARVALQGLSSEYGPGYLNGKVASLTTVGSPHSGIRTSSAVVGGATLPEGWALPVPGSLCGQLSCFEAGLASASIAPWARAAYLAAGVSAGQMIAQLSTGPNAFAGLPDDLRVLVLIGHFIGWEFVNPTTRRAVYLNGDGLITFHGQRFYPSGQTLPAALPDFQFETHLGATARVTERVLGLNSSATVPVNLVAPGQPVQEPHLGTHMAGLLNLDGALRVWGGVGYAHIDALTFGAQFRRIEVAIPTSGCADPAGCAHDSWTNIRDLLLAMTGGVPSSNFPTTTGLAISVSGASCTLPIVGVPMVCAVTGANLPTAVSMTASNCAPSPMSAVIGNSSHTRREFICTPLSADVLVSVTYTVPGFIGPLPSIPSFNAQSGFRDDFHGPLLDSSKWSVSPGATNYSLTNGFLNVGGNTRIDTRGKVLFSGSKIVAEYRGGGTETWLLLTDAEESSASNLVMVSNTSYRGWGLNIQAYGTYSLTGIVSGGSFIPAENTFVAANRIIDPAIKYYRLTVEGNLVILERGDSSVAFSERIVATMGSSVEGRRFYLTIGTGTPPYAPGVFDWVNVEVTP